MRSEHLEAINGHVDASPLVAGQSRVLAADSAARWAAIFTVEIDAELTAYSQIVVAQSSDSSGRWEDVASGGGRRQLETTPWLPTPHCNGGLVIIDTFGMDVESEDGAELGLLAIAGFGTERTDSVVIRHDDSVRVVHLSPPLRPFVVLAIGTDEISLTAREADIEKGPAEVFQVWDRAD